VKKKILFVDDEPHVLEGLKRLLHGHAGAWDMTFATSTPEAMSILLQESHDVAVLDVNMPGKGGLNLLARIKSSAETRDVEVLMLTGLKDEDLKRRALDLGASDLLTKPANKQDLIARLNSALRVRSFREKLEAQNQLLNEQLSRARKLERVGMLAAGAAHNLNSVFSAIVEHGQLLAQSMKDDAGAQEHIARIGSASTRARDLVQQIMRLSEEATGAREQCDLGQIVEECLALLRPAIPPGISIAWDGPQTTWFVKADPMQMHQVVMNLCLSACQAMEAGGTLAISLTEAKLDGHGLAADRQLTPGWYVRFDVSDTAGVVDEETRVQVFDQPSSTTKGECGGPVGLSVVHRIVRDHGGLITVESVPGEGNTFSMHLPFADQESERSSKEKTTTHVC
jgi:signal transduction histidine kinase